MALKARGLLLSLAWATTQAHAADPVRLGPLKAPSKTDTDTVSIALQTPSNDTSEQPAIIPPEKSP